MWNSKFAHKPGLAGWEACHILLQRWPACRGRFNTHPCPRCPTAGAGLGKYFGGAAGNIAAARGSPLHAAAAGMMLLPALPAQAMPLCVPPFPWGHIAGTAGGTKAAFRPRPCLGDV